MLVLTTCKSDDNKASKAEINVPVPIDTTAVLMNTMDTLWRNVELSMRMNLIGADLLRINASRDSILKVRTGKSFEEHLAADTTLSKQYAGFWKVIRNNKETFIQCTDTLKAIQVQELADGGFARLQKPDVYKLQPMNRSATLMRVQKGDSTIAVVAYAIHTNTGRPVFSDGRTTLIKWSNVLKN
jgi:hypothetical protein